MFNIIFTIFITIYISGCTEPGMTDIEKDIWLKKQVKLMNEKDAKELNVSVDEFNSLKKGANSLGLTVYQYKDKLEKEKKDALLLEALNKINTLDNKNSLKSEQNLKLKLKEEYSNNTKKEYNFNS